MDDDDEIIDAEIVEDDLLPAVIERFGVAAVEAEAFLEERRLPPGSIAVVLTFEQRQLVRTALAHYHDNGPRQRSTGFILDTLTWIADHEESQRCALCENTGKVRTMYGMHFCSCPKGVSRRHTEG